PDALLKLGYAQYAQKQYPAAKATLTDVTKKYPGTDAAKLAADRLKRIPEQKTTHATGRVSERDATQDHRDLPFAARRSGHHGRAHGIHPPDGLSAALPVL